MPAQAVHRSKWSIIDHWTIVRSKQASPHLLRKDEAPDKDERPSPTPDDPQEYLT
jgi:hypothetical protein